MAPSTPRRIGILAGVIGMLAAIITLQFGEWWFGAVSIIDTLADGVLLILPVSAFSALKDIFGTQAKTLLLIGIILGMLITGAWSGMRIAASRANARTRAITAASGMCASMIVLLWAVADHAVMGRFAATIVTIIAAALVYAVVAFVFVHMWLDSQHVAIEGRRDLLIHAGGALIALFATALLGRQIFRTANRQITGKPTTGAMPPAITPIADFYTISKNFSDPDNDRGPGWTIHISGNVSSERNWSRTELAALGEKHTITTQLCISNEVGGDLIGTADWTGLPLATLLDTAGAPIDGGFVHFEGADGYRTSVPMERCRGDQSWIVWGMNGEALPEKHGAPVRAIIPGLYGMKSVKWLTNLTVSDTDELGYWEQRGWTNEAVVKAMSRIDVPNDGDVLTAGDVRIGGIAFGGDTGVRKVEVSLDGGDRWEEATITEQPNPTGIAWVLWTWAWTATSGDYDIAVRMTDQMGQVQSDERASPLPDGSSGWHRIHVRVV